MIKKFRDVTILNIEGSALTIACDSCSGVGTLKEDIVNADGFTVGYKTAFVTLAETICLGSTPLLIVNNLSTSMDEYGKDIVAGIKKAAEESGLSGENVITGSTEDNFIVPVTSLGITTIGKLETHMPRAIDCEYSLYLAGLPLVGKEVLDNPDEILSLESLRKIISKCKPYDIIPVGSKGIGHEIVQLEESLNCKYIRYSKVLIDFNKSAGPATCAIFAANALLEETISTLSLPIKNIGTIIPK